MILNISGRTDIVAFYTPWLLKRYEEGYVDTRNPFNEKLVSRIYFEDVDLLLFCTKNPIPILEHLQKFKQPILFHVTLTPYKKDIEPNVPDKKEIINAIKKLSSIVGKENLWVRYDPIFLSEKYSLLYHKKAFAKMCSLLNGYVSQIIISFLDDYKNVRKNKSVLKFREFTEEDYKEIGVSFSKIAKEYNMTVQTCFEEKNLVEYGFLKKDCIPRELAYSLTGKEYKSWKARKEKKCQCVQLVDIGEYNSCRHFCKYCYANYDEKRVEQNFQNHDVNSTLSVGELAKDDIIKVRRN